MNPLTDTRMLAVVQSLVNIRVPGRVRPASGAAFQLSRLALWLRVGAAASLVLFHAALFWVHLLTGRLLEPAVASRWAIGLLLIAVLWALRRAGVSLLFGRRALVVWVLVALLHVSAGRPASTDIMTASPVDATLSVMVLPAAGLVCAAGLLLLAALTLRGWRLPTPAVRIFRSFVDLPFRSARSSPRLIPRGPPIPAHF